MKKNLPVGLLIGIAMVFLLFTQALASGGSRAVKTKTGILLVTFGTSVPQAQRAFDHIGDAVKAAFPHTPVRWAYTSHMIRKKLAKQGRLLDSPEIALARMMDEGFTHVAVQSLHTIPGKEFHDLLLNARRFEGMAGGIKRIAVGQPLLSADIDLARSADAVLKMIPEQRRPQEAVVMMGHGTSHPSNAFYAALVYRVQLNDPNLFIGTVEEFPEIDLIKRQLINRKITKAYLIPLMSVAGDHARNDLSGDDPRSWKSILTLAGIECVPVLKGTAEFAPFVEIWIDHLKSAVNRLGH